MGILADIAKVGFLTWLLRSGVVLKSSYIFVIISSFYCVGLILSKIFNDGGASYAQIMISLGVLVGCLFFLKTVEQFTPEHSQLDYEWQETEGNSKYIFRKSKNGVVVKRYLGEIVSKYDVAHIIDQECYYTKEKLLGCFFLSNAELKGISRHSNYLDHLCEPDEDGKRVPYRYADLLLLPGVTHATIKVLYDNWHNTKYNT